MSKLDEATLIWRQATEAMRPAPLGSVAPRRRGGRSKAKAVRGRAKGKGKLRDKKLLTDPRDLTARRAELRKKYEQEFRALPPKLRLRPSPLLGLQPLTLSDGRKGVVVTMAFPPESTNNLYQNVGKLRRLQPEVRWYKARMILELFEQIGDLYLPGYLANEFRVFMPYRGRGDLANHEKLATDIMMIVLGNDDSRVDFLSMKREYDAKRPRIELSIIQVPAPAYDAAEERRQKRVAKQKSKADAKDKKPALVAA